MPNKARILWEHPLPRVSAQRRAARAAYRCDEGACVIERLQQAQLPEELKSRIYITSRRLAEYLQDRQLRSGGINALLQEFELSTQEGVVLMCLAEALLRIPDGATVDALIRDKIGAAEWAQHIGKSEHLFVNASAWALMFTDRVIGVERGAASSGLGDVLQRLLQRYGEAVIRSLVVRAVSLLGSQFVLGETIEQAKKRALNEERKGYRYSYDMLGEAACTMSDARAYFDAYAHAIGSMAGHQGQTPIEAPGISVKLSALHPRYEYAQRDRVLAELTPRILELARLARQQGIGLCVDAEEADRLDLSLDVIEILALDPGLRGWDGLGMAVQAYQKSAVPVIDWAIDLAQRARRRIMLRLVKGAYWDTEIKHSQVGGFSNYPVFTRKLFTDVSYVACARRMLAAPVALYPCFATHNAQTAATILELAEGKEYEFQRLHGMGEALYEAITAGGHPCRIYAPVGRHRDLLAYLVRRLLENGANTSFVNQIAAQNASLDELLADPVEKASAADPLPHPRIPLPRDIFGECRINSEGIDLADPLALQQLQQSLQAELTTEHGAIPSGYRDTDETNPIAILNPADCGECVGHAQFATQAHAQHAFKKARSAFCSWENISVEQRAAALERAAQEFENQRARLLALLVKEAGKSIPDAIAELREAVDFLRYYAVQARTLFASPISLSGPTGERNELRWHGRGVFLCISPWNFPLAIFTGQIAAALCAGNTVLAKPAEQTPLVASLAVQLLHHAGVPLDVLQLLPGDGPSIGEVVLSMPQLAGVAFTGSTETAWLINRKLAARDAAIVPLIAETGGQNTMIVDSSALPEQVTRDVLQSAFQSAGQRCSALRVLFLQEDIAAQQLEMIAGAMAELEVGDPALLTTDVGPVIDADALVMLREHAQRMHREGQLVYQVGLADDLPDGYYFAPCAFEIERLDQLQGEVFGPILHVIRYRLQDLDTVIDNINATGYGLTVSIHSRIDERIAYILDKLKVGNAYVNRNQIGAVVGVQPFGGEGLSGTGPKAGGPHYLYRFATERVCSTDTTAAGGNAHLMTLSS